VVSPPLGGAESRFDIFDVVVAEALCLLDADAALADLLAETVGGEFLANFAEFSASPAFAALSARLFGRDDGGVEEEEQEEEEEEAAAVDDFDGMDAIIAESATAREAARAVALTAMAPLLDLEVEAFFEVQFVSEALLFVPRESSFGKFLRGCCRRRSRSRCAIHRVSPSSAPRSRAYLWYPWRRSCASSQENFQM
jgi:hypothetical protein